MSKLSELIKELCPNGVEYKMLGDIAEMQRGAPMTKKDAREGDVPVISGGREPAYYCDLSNRAGETITVAGSGAGAGYVQYWNIPIFVCDAFSVKGCANVDTKYLYYCLSSCQDYIYSTKKGGGVPHVHISNIENMRIPLPPLKIQQEIVKILDKFTELQAELQAELELRSKQYEHYRDRLINSNNIAIPSVKITEVAGINRGRRVTKEQIAGCSLYDVYQNSLTPLGKYDEYNCPENTTFLIAAGAAGEIGFSYEKFWAADDCYFFVCGEYLNSRYLYHALRNKKQQITSLVRRASIPRISRGDVENLKIPLPSLDAQERIVNVLDNFESICADLNIGLPAEMNLRQRQYEYYRDALLTYAETGHIISQTDRQTDRQTDID